MSRLEDRFRDLDRVEVPHLWPGIESHSSGPPRPIPTPGDRVLATVLAVAVSVGGIGVAALAFLGRGAGDQVAVTGRAREIGLECEVRLPTSEVFPGETVQATFTYRNVGDETLSLGLVDPMTPRLLVRDRAGGRLWDTDLGGYRRQGTKLPYELEPGASVRARSAFVVLWGGRLTLEPICDYAVIGPNMQVRDHGVIDLPPLLVDVGVPGETPTAAEALDGALAHTGGLFDQCRPATDGAVVTGSIAPPRVSEGEAVPDVEAACRADVRREPGFAVVDLLYASPADVPLPPPGGEGSISGLELRRGAGAGQIARWTFLVAEGKARSVTQPIAGDVDPEGGDLLSVVRFPRICPGALDCHVVLFRPRGGGGWSRIEYPSRSGLTTQQGVAFLAPDPLFPIGEPVVLESGSSAGVRWSMVVVPTSQGVALGWELDAGESFQRVVNTVPDPCPVSVLGEGIQEGRDLTAPTDGSDLLFVGPVAKDVAAVEVSLTSGRSAEAEIVPIPDELAAFDAFVVFIDGEFGDDLASVTAFDLRERPIEAPEACA
jgi:hypothetical protein